MIAILGAGPHGCQIAQIAKTPGCFSRYEPYTSLYDDNLPGYESVAVGAASFPYIAGLAWPWTRRALVERVRERGFSWQAGVVVFPGAQIGHLASLGFHVHVLYNAVVSHGCTVGAFSTICAGAVLGGEVTVGEGVLIGANATILHGGITIGDNAKIGAGAVVTRDVPAGATVVGNPAR